MTDKQQKVEVPATIDPATPNISGNDNFAPTGIIRPEGYTPIYKKVFINNVSEGEEVDKKESSAS